jgi:hypothetical protein
MKKIKNIMAFTLTFSILLLSINSFTLTDDKNYIYNNDNNDYHTNADEPPKRDTEK